MPSNASTSRIRIVVSGSYRKAREAMAKDFCEFVGLGCDVTSPKSVEVATEIQGFVYFRGEEIDEPSRIERRHMDAILEADAVWLHAPGGYIGPSGAMEVGWAFASGVRVFARESLTEAALRPLVQLVEGPAQAVERIREHAAPLAYGLEAYQHYYQRVAVERGYDRENATDCLLLALEEMGELARSIRKRRGLTRHHSDAGDDSGREIADVMLYMIHLSNILGLSLPELLAKKERENHDRYIRSTTSPKQ